MSIETTHHKYEYLKFNKTIVEEYLLLQEKYSKIYNKDKTIILMQVGGFHEAYATKTRGFNLHKLGTILKTVVSKKNKKITEVSEKNPYMMGFPLVATPKYIQMLINNNFHVIKIDQVTEVPNPKRAITGIYSPGTYIDDINSQDSKNILGWLLSLGSLSALIFGVISSVRFSMRTMTSFDLIVIIISAFGGLGLFLRSLKSIDT